MDRNLESKKAEYSSKTGARPILGFSSGEARVGVVGSRGVALAAFDGRRNLLVPYPGDHLVEFGGALENNFLLIKNRDVPELQRSAR